MTDPTPSMHQAAEQDALLLTRVREQAPLVHCLTNVVVASFTANTLLALGASPAMVDVPGEAGIFAGIADGMLVNLGTPAPDQQVAIREAVAARAEAGRGWVLDPVAVGGLPVRTALAHELLAARPAIIRGNGSEIGALAGSGAAGRGTDSLADPQQMVGPATQLAVRTGGAVAVSGEVDEVVDARRRVQNLAGTPMLTRVTGGGCALGAVMAAYLAVEDDPWVAARAALGAYTVAAARAAQRADGPGSFAAAFLDRLSSLEPGQVRDAAHLRLPAEASA